MPVAPSQLSPASSLTDDALLPRRLVLRDVFHVGPLTAYRGERNNPQWPHPIKIGGRVYYLRSEVERFIARAATAARKAVNKGAPKTAQATQSRKASRRATTAKAGAHA